MPKTAFKQVYYLLSALPAPTECLLLELSVQLDGAASFELINSGAIYCFVQCFEIPNSCEMFAGSELKVQLTTGH